MNKFITKQVAPHDMIFIRVFNTETQMYKDFTFMFPISTNNEMAIIFNRNSIEYELSKIYKSIMSYSEKQKKFAIYAIQRKCKLNLLDLTEQNRVSNLRELQRLSANLCKKRNGSDYKILSHIVLNELRQVLTILELENKKGNTLEEDNIRDQTMFEVVFILSLLKRCNEYLPFEFIIREMKDNPVNVIDTIQNNIKQYDFGDIWDAPFSLFGNNYPTSLWMHQNTDNKVEDFNDDILFTRFSTYILDRIMAKILHYWTNKTSTRIDGYIANQWHSSVGGIMHSEVLLFPAITCNVFALTETLDIENFPDERTLVDLVNSTLKTFLKSLSPPLSSPPMPTITSPVKHEEDIKISMTPQSPPDVKKPSLVSKVINLNPFAKRNKYRVAPTRDLVDGGKGKEYIRLIGKYKSTKQYVVYIDSTCSKKYIKIKGNKVFLETIKGQYRYCTKSA